jgi:hypothetical protein
MKEHYSRLFDENLVKNIMISTGLSMAEQFNKRMPVSAEELASWIERNAETIINNTIEELNAEETDDDPALSFDDEPDSELKHPPFDF